VMNRLLRRFRSEDWKRLYDYNSDTTAPLSFVSDLVSGEFTDKSVDANLLKVAWEDPIANRICVLLSQNVFDDWFVLKKKGEKDGELVEHPDNQQIQAEFTRMNAKYYFTEALIGERILGKTALVFNFNLHRTDVVGNGYQVATLDVFTPENMNIPNEAYDPETGEPQYIVVYPNATNENMTQKIPWTDVQWWCTRPRGRSYDGYSAMHSVWDLMTYLRESLDAMSWAFKKFGLGIWMWYVKGGMSTELFTAIATNLKDINQRRALVVEDDKVSKVEWSGPNQGDADIVGGMDFQLGQISAGCGIPKMIFTGTEAGAITGSEINNKAVYATINKIQSDVTPNILNTIQRMGYDPDEMIVEWNTRYATDELEQAQIRLLNAQAAQMEMIAERGYDPNAISVRVKDGEDMKQEQNPTGVQAKT
jgi:hypothetical protein